MLADMFQGVLQGMAGIHLQVCINITYRWYSARSWRRVMEKCAHAL